MTLERTKLDTPYAPMPTVAGRYFYTVSPFSATAATTGTGATRAYPWLVTKKITIDQMGAEVTVVGDVGSTVRLGIYADSGDCYPGGLLLDAGTINGNSATVQTVSVTAFTLPAGLYWVASVAQNVTTTMPTLRLIGTTWTPPVSITTGSTLPSAGQQIHGYQHLSVTGALPSTWTSTVTVSGASARVFVRTA